MLAAERGMTAVCGYLLSRDADVITVDDRGKTTSRNLHDDTLGYLPPAMAIFI